MSSPRPIVEKDQQTETRLAPPWKVIVLDDPINLMTYVTHVFMRVFGYPRPHAEQLMLEVHYTGSSVVWTGGREQAEVYCMKLLAAHLHTVLEPVEE